MRPRIRRSSTRPASICSSGEAWTAAARGAYTGKPRPVDRAGGRVRRDGFGHCCCSHHGFDRYSIPLLRVVLEPSAENGLAAPSRIMVDKLATMPRTNLRERVGVLTDHDLVQLGRSMMVFLGLA